MKSLTTKTYTTLLLALLAALWSTNAWALTINVSASQKPYVYAWYGNTEFLGSFPGTELTSQKTYGGETWYYIDVNASEVNIILSFGSGASQTATINLNKNKYYRFTSNTANDVTDFVDYPNGVNDENGNYTYLVNVNGWEKVYAYIYDETGIENAEWPGEEMTKVGKNNNGFDVYKWTGTNPSNPQTIIFNNTYGNQSDNLPWENGAIWSNFDFNHGVITGVVLDSEHFPDVNFRTALSSITNVKENNILPTRNITVLDVSNKGISDLTGIANFTNLEELYAGNNNLTHLVLTGNSKLQILDIKNNTSIKGFSSNSATSSNNYINMSPSSNPAQLKKLDASGCTDFGYFRAIHDTYGISSLEWLSLNGCTAMNGWSSGITAQTGLKYLDLTNSGQNANHDTTASRISVTGLTGLETLILADNTSLCSSTYLDLTHNTNLKYLDLSNTGLNETRAKTTLNTVALANLETLKINNNSSLKYAFTEKLPRLKHFEIADGDLYFTPTYQLSTLTPTNNPNLEYLDISNAKISSRANPIDGFQNLKTVIAGSNPNMPKLTINNCPAIENIDISNNTSETILSITNSGLTSIPSINATGTTSLYKLDLTGNAFTDVPTTGIASLTTLVMNDNRLSNLNVSESNIQYLYAQNNKFGSGEYEMPETSLVGLDLGNNGFTKFKMTGNTTLKSLALSGNDALTEIELHGNTQLTQTSPDGVIESDNGLYINNLVNLEILNIENSNFNKLGQGDALIGLPKLKKLQARNNKFTTFTNGVYEIHTSSTNSVNYRKPDPTQSSLERLEALEYLDLAYNNLQDSVHLYRNTALKHLDVSYNRSIDGQLDPTAEPLAKTAEQKATILEQKGRRWMKYGKVKFNGQEKVYGKNVTPEQWTAHYTNLQAHRMRPFDLRDCDLNDTTGLYHLDLHNNVNLEYINFSYTNIHNTAAGPTFMCPGWMDEDWVGDDDFSAGNVSGKNSDGRWFSSWHTFVYFIPCSKLKVIHADHNNLSGFGVRYFPELDTLTCSYMYGESALMRDFPTGSINATSYEDLCYWKGNTGLQTSIKKFDHIDWDNVENPQKSYGVVLTGPDGNPTGNFPNKVRYYDNSYSSFNEIRFYPGNADNGSLPYLEYVNVSGNPLKCQSHPNSSVSYHNSLDLTYCPNIKTVLANNCDSLPTVRAYNRDALTTLDLTNDPQLKTVYVQDNEVLPSITGLSTLTGLETLFAYNNRQFGGIDVSNNTALKNLWVSNIGASSLDVSNNTGLLKLRAYDNLLTTLNVSANTALTWLDVARNQIPSLDLSTNAALQYFNCSNSEETLDDQSLAANNHNGGEADEVKPVTGNHSADDSGNSLSDLVFNTEALIADVRANSNDLHKITGSFGNLTHIEFAHNHINGIDLSAATGLTPADVIDEDNGRAITAECSKFYKNGDMNNAYTIYYFQLDPNAPAQHGGELLTNKTSIDSKKTLRIVGNDGLVIDNIDTWGGSNGNSGKLTMDVTVTPGNMGDYLNADDVIGTIVVLDPEKVTTAGAEGHATYTYKNGVSDSSTEDTSEFYLDWSSDGTVTGIDGVKVVDGVSVAGSYGQLTVTGADGTAIGIYDMNGRQVSNATITGGHATVTGLAPGIYLVNGQRVLVR